MPLCHVPDGVGFSADGTSFGGDLHQGPVDGLRQRRAGHLAEYISRSVPNLGETATAASNSADDAAALRDVETLGSFKAAEATLAAPVGAFTPAAGMEPTGRRRWREAVLRSGGALERPCVDALGIVAGHLIRKLGDDDRIGAGLRSGFMPLSHSNANSRTNQRSVSLPSPAP